LEGQSRIWESFFETLFGVPYNKVTRNISKKVPETVIIVLEFSIAEKSNNLRQLFLLDGLLV
jgi:hypothetical protein